MRVRRSAAGGSGVGETGWCLPVGGELGGVVDVLAFQARGVRLALEEGRDAGAGRLLVAVHLRRVEADASVSVFRRNSSRRPHVPSVASFEPPQHDLLGLGSGGHVEPQVDLEDQRINSRLRSATFIRSSHLRYGHAISKLDTLSAGAPPSQDRDRRALTRLARPKEL